MQISPFRLALAAAISLALAGSLSACGGGSNVRPDAPQPQPADTCKSGCDPAPGGMTSDRSGRYPAYNQLTPTHVIEAHKAGYTGKHVKVALMDSGIDPSLAPLAHLTIHFRNMLVDGGADTPNDSTGHGSVMAQTLAGARTDKFVGGVAPDVELYVGQICSDEQGGCGVGASDAETFYRQGERLFNYSMGATGEDPSDPGFKQFIGSFQGLVDGGSLLVWAAGNAGPDKLSAYAAAPSTVGVLQQGWLAVVNVRVDDNGRVGGLDDSSARCGVAADWCLAAPGEAKFIPIAGSEFTTGHADGTSTSAATVSGVAALVWQAYPWMSGHNVQQTLLTTATHLGGGDPNQPNATFGWGLVDAARAMHGPAQFVGNFVADIGAAQSTFGNAISGAGSLTLDGNRQGVLTLSADNSFSGGTVIHGGRLHLGGSLASDVMLDGGVLAGDGIVHAGVHNVAGTVASIRAVTGRGLTITGNYTSGAGGTTAVALGHPLTVGQTARLDGTLLITPPRDSYTPKATETLLTAGKVTGTFATSDASALAFYTANVSYTDTTVTAALERKAVVQSVPQSTPVVAAASRGLDNALRQADGWSGGLAAQHTAFLDTAARFLGTRGRARAMASVRSLSGEIHATVGAIEAATARQVDHAVALRQNGMRPGDDAGLWVQGLSSDSGLSQSGYASARSRGHGMLAGVDVPLGRHFSAGLLLGEGRATSHLDSLAGRVTQQNTLGGVYARYRFPGGIYLSGRATWTHVDVKVRRTALIGHALQVIHTQRSDGVGRITLEVGKGFGFVTPYVALGTMRIKQGAFAEHGAGGFGLSARSHHHEVALGRLGVRMHRRFAWAGGRSVLTGHAAWQRVLSGTRLDFSASLVGAPAAAFTVTGQSLVRNVGQVGIKLDTRISRAWDWYVDVNAQGAVNRYHAFAANAGVRFHF
ncbi:MAG TPA: autotransporter domain-containing protein [Oleiagrimonas sp.]|nr:autotransporter domain-containing protein [Oleiagrimonas sp.]